MQKIHLIYSLVLNEFSNKHLDKNMRGILGKRDGKKVRLVPCNVMFLGAKFGNWNGMYLRTEEDHVF
jgi:hypothetical protein